MKLVLCDLDGTLADCEHRQHYVRGEGKKQWGKFFNDMHLDPVNEKLNHILRLLDLDGDVKIIFVTARPNTYEEKTVQWLEDRAGWQPHEYDIYMRDRKDMRKDSIVKADILKLIKVEYPDSEILCVFDDRKQVVEMWREENILTLQVADHDF